MEAHGGRVQADYWSGGGIDQAATLTRVMDSESGAMYSCSMLNQQGDSLGSGGVDTGSVSGSATVLDVQC